MGFVVSRSAVLVTILLTLICYHETPVRACQCSSLRAGPACQAVWNVEAVFVGRVMDVKEFGVLGPRHARLQVLEAFRGVSGNEVVVGTASEVSCGISLPVGATFLVYAWRSENILWTNACSRTNRLEQAATDLAYLRGVGRQPAGAGQIQGIVYQVDPDETGRYDFTLLSNIRVIARALPAGKQVMETRTQLDGSYSISAAPGRYDVDVEIRDGLYAQLESVRPVELKDVRGCVDATFQVRSDGRISGRVVDARGAAVPHLAIDLVSDSKRRQSSSFDLRDGAITDELGRFEFIHLEPDSYVVGIHLMHRFRTDGRDVRFASAPDRLEDLIEVRKEARVDVGEFRLPESVEVARLSGVVRDASGQPVAGALVYLGIVSGPHVTDTQGRFQITTVAGREYQLLATVPDQVNPLNSRRVESPRFIASSSLPPFELRLNR